VVLLVRHLPCFQRPLLLEVCFLDAEMLPLKDVQVVENLQLVESLVVIALGKEEAQVRVHCLQLIFGEVGCQHGIDVSGAGDVGLRETFLGLLRSHQHLVALAQLVFVDLIVCVLADPVLPLPLGVDVVDLQLVVPLMLDVAGALRAVHQTREQLSDPRFQHLLVLENLGILLLVTVLLVEDLVELTDDGPAEAFAQLGALDCLVFWFSPSEYAKSAKQATFKLGIGLRLIVIQVTLGHRGSAGGGHLHTPPALVGPSEGETLLLLVITIDDLRALMRLFLRQVHQPTQLGNVGGALV
jgi:hypothetical protein